MEQAVIPSSITGTMSDAVKQFQRLGALKLLSGPPLAGVCPLKHRLISSGLRDAQQQQFATHYAANCTDMPAFWKDVSLAFGQDIATGLQRDGKLARSIFLRRRAGRPRRRRPVLMGNGLSMETSVWPS